MTGNLDALLEHLGVPIWTTRPNGNAVLRKNLADEIEDAFREEYEDVIETIAHEVADSKTQLAKRIRLVLEGKTP